MKWSLPPFSRHFVSAEFLPRKPPSLLPPATNTSRFCVTFERVSPSTRVCTMP
jgi:hypothetical protein